MAAKHTHTFKQINSLDLKADIYTRFQNAPHLEYPRSQPVALFFHGGGFVTSDREDIPPHIVQQCLLRNWILVSTDYRKLPQISGTEMWEDARDAFVFVRESLPGILTGRQDGGRFENIILIGRSAGAYLAYLCAHTMNPKPTGVLAYYGITSMSDPFFHAPHQMGPAPLQHHQVQPLYDESITKGSTLASKKFDPSCLLPDLTRNPTWKKPDPEPPNQRIRLVPWFLEEVLFPKMLGMVDVALDDGKWKEFPPTILIHGDKDPAAPYECSVRLVEAIGEPPAKLFTAVGQGHAFDEGFFVGDLGLEGVEEAWLVLDRAVDKRVQEMENEKGVGI